MNPLGRNLALWVIIALILVALFNLFQSPSVRNQASNIAYSDFVNDANNGQVADVTIQGNTITGHMRDGRSFSTYAPSDPNLVQRLTERGVRVNAQPPE